MIRVLFLSTFDNIGGAAKATQKLYKALFRYDLGLQMLVKKKLLDDPSIHRIFTFFPATIHLKLDRWLLSEYGDKNRSFWSLALLPNWFLWIKLQALEYDIVQLNWINAGFVPIKLLKYIKKPIIWRLSDSWAFTGGCHWHFECNKFTTGCNACPQLESNDKSDYSYKVFSRKLKHWKNIDLTLVAPSKWMQRTAQSSKLFKDRKVVYIPTGINISIFKPMDAMTTRNSLGLPLEKKIILFGAVDAVTDPNKGFHLLVEALNHLYAMHENPEQIELLVFGHPGKSNRDTQLKFKSTFVGSVKDASLLNQYYAASDVFILPSIMDNSPNTVIEAMGSGTPVVAFDACGTSELIDHLTTGYLAAPYSTADLATGIMHILKDTRIAKSMGAMARKKVEENYNIEDVASQYYMLYKQIYQGNKSNHSSVMR